MTENGIEVDEAKDAGDSRRSGLSPWRVLGWVMVGALLAMALVAIFVAYGQPELLLEQMNLRYCG
ncbi:MAG: hypothetical protein RBS28_00965 [Rhodocyclaceae bacterium]|jgi:lipopolysaccharide export LptBFGC system permease protein LptF|nr:hypothetical protein [Rhodocyclaceae bacterium]